MDDKQVSGTSLRLMYIAANVVEFVLSALYLVVLWGMVVTPMLDVNPLTYTQALLLSLVIECVTMRRPDTLDLAPLAERLALTVAIIASRTVYTALIVLLVAIVGWL